MRTVAERLLVRMPAPAQGDRFLARRQDVLIAQVVENAHRQLHNKRTILPTLDRKWVGHRLLLSATLKSPRNLTGATCNREGGAKRGRGSRIEARPCGHPVPPNP